MLNISAFLFVKKCLFMQTYSKINAISFADQLWGFPGFIVFCMQWDLGPLLLTIPAWISNHINYEMSD